MFKKVIFDLYKNSELDINECNSEFDMVLDYLHIDRLKEIKGEEFSQKEKSEILKIIEERVKTQKPLQYILGYSYFMGDKFLVDSSTLIPRPETEILVTECAKKINEKLKVLDIGAGTGCISIEIKKLTNATIDGVDISKEALKIAKKNAEFHNVDCNFFYSDLFSNVKEKYDFIISNPPYIPQSEKVNMTKTVKDFEPHAALFTNDEFGIEFYEKIIKKSVTYLNKNGFIGFELGIHQADKVFEMLKNNGFSDIQIIKDLDEIERVTIAKYLG